MKKAERLADENRRIDAELQKKTSILGNLTEVSGKGGIVLKVVFYLNQGIFDIKGTVLIGFWMVILCGDGD